MNHQAEARRKFVSAFDEVVQILPKQETTEGEWGTRNIKPS